MDEEDIGEHQIHVLREQELKEQQPLSSETGEIQVEAENFYGIGYDPKHDT